MTPMQLPAAASNLNALVNLNQATYWPAGTDNATIEGTKALPSIWSDFAGVMEVSAGMTEAGSRNGCCCRN